MVAALKSSDLLSQSIKDEEFEAMSRLVYENFGIVLSQEKRTLVVGRLNGCLSRRNIHSFSEYLALLKADKSKELLSELANQISTNFTSFYRESSHFDFLVERALPEVLERLRKRGSRDLRIWCAACSSGEEAYTIQMNIQRKLGLDYNQWDAGLLATDISEKVLRLAKNGVYSREQLEKVPSELLNGYFRQQSDGTFAVKESVKNQILFRRFNLMNASFPFVRPFQIIFCRNVMIYFDDVTRQSLIRKFLNLLEPGGYLFIGHSESIGPNWSEFESMQTAVYRKRNVHAS